MNGVRTHNCQKFTQYSINVLQKMEHGRHGANGILVPDHVTEGTKPELGHVPIHRLTTSVKIRSVVIIHNGVLNFAILK
jgi:hypothetical protein